MVSYEVSYEGSITMKILRTDKEWQDLLCVSQNQPVLVFKHSSVCPISARAYQEVASFLEEFTDVVSYMIVVQDTPDLKTQIADEMRVQHESPQVLFIYDKKVTAYQNHSDITNDWLVGEYKNYTT